MAKIAPLFCTPAFGGMVMWKYFTSMMNLGLALKDKGIAPLFYGVENESLVSRARNDCVGHFLKTDTTHLFFVDADVGFSPQDAFDALRCGLDVVFGAYPKKSYFWDAAAKKRNFESGTDVRDAAVEFVVRFEGKETLARVIDGIRLLKCRDGGAGFLCIRREALIKMIESYPERKYTCTTRSHEGEARWDLFPNGLAPASFGKDQQEYLGEDHGFVDLWRRIGGECWVLADAQLSHTGTHTFLGQFGPKK